MSAPMHPNESARLACLRSLSVLDSAPEPMFDDVARLATTLTGCPVAIVGLVDECREWYMASIGMQGNEQPREASICQHVVATDRPLILRDASKDPDFADQHYVTGPFGLRFYAGYPIMVEGLPVGTLCVLDTRPHDPSEAVLEALAALARQTARLMESRRTERSARAAETRFSALMDHMPSLAFLKDGERRMQYVNEGFERIFDVAPGELLGKRDEEWLPAEAHLQTVAHDCHVLATREVLEVIEQVPTADGRMREWSVQKFPVTIEGATWVGGTATDVTEIHEARRAAQAERDFSEAVLGNGGAMILVVDSEGRLVRFNGECERVTGWRADEVLGRGFADIFYPPEGREDARAWFRGLTLADFPHAHERDWLTRGGETRTIEWRSAALPGTDGELAFIVANGIDVTLRRKQERLLWKQRRALHEANSRLRRLATTDELTRIPNRLAFRSRLAVELARAERTGTPLSLAILDVDCFKEFNDTLGHAAGDETLRRFAALLKGASRGLDLVARYGGEEFVVLMPGTGRHDATCVAERLRAAIEAADWPLRPVTASFGVATFRHLAGGADAAGEPLLAEADRALYASKAAGRNRVVHAEDSRADEDRADGLELSLAA